jgi:hypothetical protein
MRRHAQVQVARPGGSERSAHADGASCGILSLLK